jgi:exopolyphosphatase/pppGpp-phosphohydrolase
VLGAEAVLALRAHVDEALGQVGWARDVPGPLVGVGGTLRALAKVDRRARAWPISHGHGYLLGRDAIERTWEQASRLDVGRRREIAGLAAHRVDTIAAGACTVLRVMAARRTDEIRINSYGVREGAALRAFLGVDLPVLDDPLGAELASRFGATDGSGASAGEQARAAVSEVLARADQDVREEVGGVGSTLRTGLEIAAWLTACGVREGARLVASDGAKDRPLHGATQESVLVAHALLAATPAHGLSRGTHRRMQALLRAACAVQASSASSHPLT